MNLIFFKFIKSGFSINALNYGTLISFGENETSKRVRFALVSGSSANVRNILTKRYFCNVLLFSSDLHHCVLNLGSKTVLVSDTQHNALIRRQTCTE